MRHSSVILTNSPQQSRLVPGGAAAVLTALAAWVSLGTIGVDASGARIGLLATGAWPFGLAIAAALFVLTLAVKSASPRGVLIAASPLALILLPWLPIPLPAALAIWTGPVVTLIWTAVIIALLASFARSGSLAIRSSRSERRMEPRAQALTAGALSLVVFSAAAWSVSPVLPAGDEPHYLVITQSLLYDHDLKIENNHRRGDYHAYFAGMLNPDAIRRGRNGGLYSIHAPGVPALVLPAFALGGYYGVVVFLLLLSSAGCALIWWLAWKETGSSAAAWFGWSAVALSPPFLFESFTVFPDGPAAVVMATGFWALLRADWEREQQNSGWKPWLLHGVALATLPWMHTRFAVLAAALGGMILLRIARGPDAAAKAIAFLAAPAISAVAWLAFFVSIYGTPDPSAPYAGQIQSSFAFLPNGVGGLFFDQGFGVIATAPVLLVAFAGFRYARRLALEWIVVSIPYLVTVTTFAMWWAGLSGPARFFVPLLPPLAIPAAHAWTSMTRRGVRAAAAAALTFTCWLSMVSAMGGGGRLAYHTRNEGGATGAPWIEWSVPALDVASAVPAFVPLPVGTPIGARQAATRDGFVILVPWVLCVGAAIVTIRLLADRSLRDPSALAAATTFAFALAVTGALAIGWRLRGADPNHTAAAQTTILQRMSRDSVAAIDLTARAAVPRAGLLSRVRIETTPPRVPRLNQPLAAIPLLPAGDYVVETSRRGGDGWLMVGIGTDQFTLVTQPAAAFDSGVPFRFPVDVRALVVRGDEDARQHVDLVRVRPLRVLRASEKVTTEVARRAVRYGSIDVFFLDERAFPEPGAFWVGGARQTTVVIAPDQRESMLRVSVRNVPVENVVTLESGRWHQELSLSPGEERLVEIPIDPARGAALVRITSSAGFRPSQGDQATRDTRFLGVYVRVGS